MKYDAIIVLGGGVNYDGTINEISKYRVELSSKLLNSGISDRIIMSTKWSGFLNKKPVKTEAEAMKSYALRLGMPNFSILKEEESMDTIGNAIFTKQNFLIPNNWKKIIVVTSDFHMPRTKYIFKKIMGPEYEMGFRESKSSSDGTISEERIKTEQQLLSFTRLLFDNTQDGDDKSTKEKLFLVHPFYSDNWKKLVELSDEELAKIITSTIEVSKKYKEFIKNLENVPRQLYEFG